MRLLANPFMPKCNTIKVNIYPKNLFSAIHIVDSITLNLTLHHYLKRHRVLLLSTHVFNAKSALVKDELPVRYVYPFCSHSATIA